ncbi:unnamed protein product [Bursaphelenchus xylophilus]|uniref:(pine wood nematode) hypothetical protein n=1 Tax=Bursaphelenchus xylophilus TaxID=6326 RepID=A0A1I7RLN4_BURXY|nr:unnamed protein product [Bursaphelenchus xylophilus]CAG9082780.1 unnamed protein product [Bursaphelenchus xylophilus]
MFAALFQSLQEATQLTWAIVILSMFVLSCILTWYCTWRCRHEGHSYVLDPNRQRNGNKKTSREFYV